MAGQVSSENVIGRDRLIEQIWKKLETKSLRFTAERRIGKTTVMKKMAAESRPGKLLLFFDLEGIDSPNRFTEVLLTKIKPLASGKQKARDWFDTFLASIGGLEVGGAIKIPDRNKVGWQVTLEKAFEGICLQQSESVVVLLFDELPYMLQKIQAIEKRSGSIGNAALEMLDVLRALRHQHTNLRMIFAGSVGLHHVLGDLRGTEFASQPVNDMPAVEINALDLIDATTLARRLLQSEAVDVIEADSAALPETLARLTDRVPFYLERVVARLAEFADPVSINDAQQVVRQHLTDENDAWEMEHFRQRLQIYYLGISMDANEKPLENWRVASAILDILSVAPKSQSIDEIWGAIKAKLPLVDRVQIIELLKSLARDHYLTSDTEKRYSFRFPLIQQWWILAQGLSP